ncbi:SulP family inorganic anion transporter [Paracoccus tegillarcae]|nr:SulP family inorganic anion transporter [Paracoccus tegillarcae]
MSDFMDRALPPRRWLSRVTAETLRQDAFAGFSNAAIVIPQGVAFATIAGLPPEMGLYTAMITAAIAAFWGSSMVMISGPTTAISAVIFATLQDLAPPGTARFVELALMITILVGLIQLAAGLARLGGLVSFVSHSVMTAFTAAAAVLIATSQLPGAFGVPVESGGNVLERLRRLVESLPETSALSLSIAAVTLGSLLICQRFARRLPGFLIALIIGSVLCHLLGGAANGVAMVGEISAAFPVFAPPTGVIGDIGALTPGAMAIALVGLLEAISIGRAFAVRRKEKFDANQEMIGQGLSNAVGGFFQCYAGSGSFTRSGVNAEAGARTPIAGILSSLFLAVMLLMFSDLIRFIPVPAMAGLILYVAWRLIDFRELRRVVGSSRSETVILALTLLAGLLVELDFAIYVGVIASFAVFIYQSSHPSIRVSAPVISATGRRKFRNADLHGIPECPQIVTIRIDGPLYFGSVEHVEREFETMRRQRPGQRHVLFYLKGVGKIDLAGADFLIDAIRQIRAEGGTFHIIALFPPLLDSLRRFHVLEEIGEDHLHISKGDALAAAIPHIDYGICATCTKRVFLECSDLPGASTTTGQGDEAAYKQNGSR